MNKNPHSNAQILLQIDQDFARLSQEAGVVEAFRTYLTQDALQLPNGSHPIIGRDSIVEKMSTQMPFLLLWEPQQAEVAESGDLGYSWGTYTFEGLSTEDERVVRYGKYTNVSKKRKDGTWKVILDMGNSSPLNE